MFGQFSEMVSSEVQYRHQQYRQEADRERQARQANPTRKNKRDKQSDVLLGVKRGRLTIEEGLNMLENV